MKGSVRDSVWTTEFDMKHEEGQRTYHLKHDYNNKDEVNIMNIISNDNTCKLFNIFILKFNLFLNFLKHLQKFQGKCPSWPIQELFSPTLNETKFYFFESFYIFLS